METEHTASETTPTQENVQPLTAATTTQTIQSQQSIITPDEIIQHCKKYLLRPWTGQRTPKGYSAAWGRLWEASQTSSTATSFYEAGGYQAWFAYFLATYSARKSRYSRSIRLNTLESCSTEIKASIADELMRTEVHATVAKAMHTLQTKFAVPRQRRPESDSPSPSPSYESEDEAQTGLTVQSIRHPASDLPLPSYFGASPIEAAQWLGHRIASSILLLGDGATVPGEKLAIGMNFPTGPSNAEIPDCGMQLTIIPNKVQHLAQELFGADLETEGALRYLVLPSGIRVLPNTDHIFVECRMNAIDRIFGSGPMSLLNDSKYRELEKKRGRLDVTGCVSMTVPADATNFASLTLSLGLKGAGQVRDALFRK